MAVFAPLLLWCMPQHAARSAPTNNVIGVRYCVHDLLSRMHLLLPWSMPSCCAGQGPQPLLLHACFTPLPLLQRSPAVAVGAASAAAGQWKVAAAGAAGHFAVDQLRLALMPQVPTALSVPHRQLAAAPDSIEGKTAAAVLAGHAALHATHAVLLLHLEHNRRAAQSLGEFLKSSPGGWGLTCAQGRERLPCLATALT